MMSDLRTKYRNGDKRVDLEALQQMAHLESRTARFQIEVNDLKTKAQPFGRMVGAAGSSPWRDAGAPGAVTSGDQSLPATPPDKVAPVFTDYELGLIHFVFANLCGDLDNGIYHKTASFEQNPRPASSRMVAPARRQACGVTTATTAS